MNTNPFVEARFEVIFLQSDTNPIDITLAKKVIRNKTHWLLIGYDSADPDRSGWYQMGKIDEVPLPELPLPVAEVDLQDVDLPFLVRISLTPPWKWGDLKVTHFGWKK